MAILYYTIISPTLKALNRADSKSVEKNVRESIAKEVAYNSDMRGYTNLALFGVDSRSGNLTGGNNRADTIIIASINNKTHELKLISFFWDTFVDIGDGIFEKANAAYSVGEEHGGPEAAVRMLNRNLDLNITDYITVGFEGLAELIDAVGGIDINITDEERKYANQYMKDMKAEIHTEYDKIRHAGDVHLNGIQATAYCRIRYTTWDGKENDDFGRAGRQRTVLKKTMEKVKENPIKLAMSAPRVASHTATSLSDFELFSLLLQVKDLKIGPQEGFPRPEYRSTVNFIEYGSCEVPDTLADNVQWLHRTLFREDPYYMSDQCAGISDSIRKYKHTYGWQ